MYNESHCLESHVWLRVNTYFIFVSGVISSSIVVRYMSTNYLRAGQWAWHLRVDGGAAVRMLRKLSARNFLPWRVQQFLCPALAEHLVFMASSSHSQRKFFCRESDVSWRHMAGHTVAMHAFFCFKNFFANTHWSSQLWTSPHRFQLFRAGNVKYSPLQSRKFIIVRSSCIFSEMTKNAHDNSMSVVIPQEQCHEQCQESLS